LYQGQKNIDSKIIKFLKILWLLHNTHKPHLKTMVLPTLLYGNETWTMRQDRHKLWASKMKIVWWTAKICSFQPQTKQNFRRAKNGLLSRNTLII
jgi:hypothetical protein